MRLRAIIVVAAALSASLGATARAEFPYSPKGGPGEYDRYVAGPGETPGDLTGKRVWMYAATPEEGNVAVNADPRELHGVRGAHVVDADPEAQTAWQVTTGRPDVTIAVLDSGIDWSRADVMSDVGKKTRIDKGEAPAPQAGRTAATEEGADCAAYRARADGSEYDLNHDGVFNVVDYACDERVDPDPAKGVGPPILDPQDVLIAFSDGEDGDGNGFVDDMVGWDFLDDDNDPFDDVGYGHGSGEARDSAGEADNGGDLGTCPNCMLIHMRVGDSFIADVNDFAQATVYAADNEVLVVQEALGTLNNSRLATQAIDYAYAHGVTVIASAADEAAQHNNWPSSNPHVILVNSVTKYPEEGQPPVTVPPPGSPGRSYLQFNGCTNFNSKITLAIPSVSCSSDATGRAAGMAGLVYSAALNAREDPDVALKAHPTCRRTDGSACLLTANEVRQLMASGVVEGRQQSDDVAFTPSAALEPSCAKGTPDCTAPFTGALGTDLRVTFPPRSYPARHGHDQFYGYGRVNMHRATRRARAAVIPPEAEIQTPGWYDFVDPEQATLPVRGEVGNRGEAYRCRLYVAPGGYPALEDFEEVGDGHCDGTTRDGDFSGPLGELDLNALRARFPADAGDFRGRETGTTGDQSSNGRPNDDPYGFVVKVVVETAQGRELQGEDRRLMRLHRDRDLLADWPRDLGGDGASSPAFADLDGDNRNELVVGTSDGLVHAFRRDGSEAPGWPAQVDRLSLHTGGRAFRTGEVSADAGGAILGAVAVGDLDRDGVPSVVVTDLEGKVTVLGADGGKELVREAEMRFSGKPLRPFENVRRGQTNRTQHGFLNAPVLADLDGDDGGRLEIVAAGMDRHVYAWNDDGSAVPGFPVLVVDRSKLGTVDPDTHAVRFDPEKLGEPLQQGAIIDTPAVGDVTGDGTPEIIVGTNEEYGANEGNEGPQNAGPFNAFLLEIIGPALLGEVNSRLHAITPAGDPDGDPATAPPTIGDEWPLPLAQSSSETLPVVGEGVTGNPVIGTVDCPEGGKGPKIGAMAHAGPAFVLNPDGTSCYGDQGGGPTPLQSDGGVHQGEAAVLNAFGHPAFADLGDGATTFLTPTLGATRALDVALPEYQGGRDLLAAWDASTGRFRTGWPARMNDLQFLTGPAVADVDGEEGQEILAASASMDLQGYKPDGTPISDRWPKLTSDWAVATPLVGTWGTRDDEPGARKVVVATTRAGVVLPYATQAGACTPSASPRHHGDNFNSGDMSEGRPDATAPGAPMDARLRGRTLRFRAPGDDLLCGEVARYELRAGDGAWQSVAPAEPVPPGGATSVRVPAGTARTVELRAVDEAGNPGRAAVAKRGNGR